MDLDTTDGIYAYVGQSLADAAPGAWRKAVLEADVGGGSVGLTGHVELNNGGREELDVHKLDLKVSKAVRNLHRIMAGGDGQDWNRADFVVEPSGEFSVKFHRDAALAADLARFEKP